MDLIIKNGTIVSPTATFKADVCVDNGKIVEITADAGTDADQGGRRKRQDGAPRCH